MSRPERRKYALADYAVELRDRGWYFGHQVEPSATYRGPYGSIASVTLTIARQLKREIERRDRQVTARASLVRPQSESSPE